MTMYFFMILLQLEVFQASEQSGPDAGLYVNSEDESDLEKLRGLNAQFIKNFINQDTISHNKIIHRDFVCIEGSGEIFHRREYMKRWTTDFQKGNFTAFSYTDEVIRIFGNMALVRSKTEYKRSVNGKEVSGNSVYTDTYIKEDDRWWCIQAQITPVKK